MPVKDFRFADLSFLTEDLKSRIEKIYEVRLKIDSRNGLVEISGSGPSVAKAKKDLNRALQKTKSRNSPRQSISENSYGNRTVKVSEKKFVPKNERQRNLWEAFDDADLVFGLGPAGTGKTFVAVSKAVDLLSRKKISKIVLCRPAVTACKEDIGFLPGKLEQKMDPYMQPIYDSMKAYFSEETVKAMIKNKVAEIVPLGFMRGMTLKDCFVIVDEAQNCSDEQFTMMLTRMGEGCKMAICGDESQSDVKKSGLREEAELHDCDPEVRVIEFLREDIVRRPLVARILRRKEERDAARKAGII